MDSSWQWGDSSGTPGRIRPRGGPYLWNLASWLELNKFQDEKNKEEKSEWGVFLFCFWFIYLLCCFFRSNIPGSAL